MDDERTYYECNTCCYGVSGRDDSTGLLTRLDVHTADNPGHKMIEIEMNE